MSQELLDRILRYRWPGNVRELENLIRRSAILSTGPEIRCRDFEWGTEEPADCLVTGEIKDLPYKDAKRLVLERFHNEYLADALSRNRGQRDTRSQRVRTGTPGAPAGYETLWAQVQGFSICRQQRLLIAVSSINCKDFVALQSFCFMFVTL